MIARPFNMLALACMMSVTTSVLAQSTPSNVSPDVMLRALETMNSAASSKLAQSIKREASLRAYIAKNDLADACGGSPNSDDAHDMAMTFDQALKIAVDHEQSTRGSYDSPATASELRAYTTLTQSTWDKLQTSDFLVCSFEHAIHTGQLAASRLRCTQRVPRSRIRTTTPMPAVCTAVVGMAGTATSRAAEERGVYFVRSISAYALCEWIRPWRSCGFQR